MDGNEGTTRKMTREAIMVKKNKQLMNVDKRKKLKWIISIHFRVNKDGKNVCHKYAVMGMLYLLFRLKHPSKYDMVAKAKKH